MYSFQLPARPLIFPLAINHLKLLGFVMTKIKFTYAMRSITYKLPNVPGEFSMSKKNLILN